jgi:predicted outer membrane protein
MFAEAMYQGHDGVLRMLSDHAKEITIPELKQFVDETTPALEHHRAVAEKLKGDRARGRNEPLLPRPIK